MKEGKGSPLTDRGWGCFTRGLKASSQPLYTDLWNLVEGLGRNRGRKYSTEMETFRKPGITFNIFCIPSRKQTIKQKTHKAGM